ncbi:hypothetical protein E3N88_44877 [Mikania micrantha]|uniref:Uncharacterized protein n=1 Tax=Mikania micrantha TaxID=192012 RepID=A0A5N6LB13_9ASTR|nr:hypothetical protein E3N88_44877 [Mikania micrantha]
MASDGKRAGHHRSNGKVPLSSEPLVRFGQNRFATLAGFVKVAPKVRYVRVWLVIYPVHGFAGGGSSWQPEKVWPMMVHDSRVAWGGSFFCMHGSLVTARFGFKQIRDFCRRFDQSGEFGGDTDRLYFLVEEVESYAWTPRTPKSVEKRVSYEALKVEMFRERVTDGISCRERGFG